MRIFLIILTLFALFSSAAQAEDRYPFSSSTQQQQFKRLTSQMRCMVCQNESLADSTSGFAEDMRSEIYKMVKAGKSDKLITQYMVKRYGYFVSFNPPFNWETYLLWLAPLLLLIIAAMIGRSVYRKYRGT